MFNSLAKSGDEIARRPFKCTVCGKRFTHNAYLETHEKIHLRKSSLYGYLLSMYTSLLMMQKLSAKGDPRKTRYECEICGKSFSRSNTLNSHKKDHFGRTDHFCEIKRKIFYRRSISETKVSLR